MIYIIPFDPIKTFIDWAPQNDRQNLSFMKAINVIDEKMARNSAMQPFVLSDSE